MNHSQNYARQEFAGIVNRDATPHATIIQMRTELYRKGNIQMRRKDGGGVATENYFMDLDVQIP